MKDAEGVAFLQWALPRLGFRWPGFRRVRRQVLRRITKRHNDLDLEDLAEYRRFLESRPEEWRHLDDCCRVTISRFYRDHGVWRGLGDEILPALAESASRAGRSHLRAWSAGCASGEEPYTLGLVWQLAVGSPMALRIVATDADPHMLERARQGRYPVGTLRELPDDWKQRSFSSSGNELVLDPAARPRIQWRCQDLREQMPDGPFDLIFCRNLAFTYFDEKSQVQILEQLVERLVPDGALVIGCHESLPDQAENLVPWPDADHGLKPVATFQRPAGAELPCPSEGNRG